MALCSRKWMEGPTAYTKSPPNGEWIFTWRFYFRSKIYSEDLTLPDDGRPHLEKLMFFYFRCRSTGWGMAVRKNNHSAIVYLYVEYQIFIL